jgi:serine/threonine protein kinase
MSSGRPCDREVLADTYLILGGLDEKGRVFKAHDRRHRRVVALRILPPPLVRDPSELKAFLRDVEAAGRLAHPNLAVVLAAGEDRGVRFVVTQYAKGSDLDRVVRDRGPLSLDQALDVVIQAARGLEAAHAHRIVHGALRPSRLMLDAAGTVRVLGVGLGRLIAAASPLEETAGPRRDGGEADLRGEDYMAPERTGGREGLDPRSDIYSLGCILYFLLTGREPFVGETLRDRLSAHRDRPAPDIRILRPDVPSTLAETYRKMMAKRQEDRPASMTEVIGMLESCKVAAPADSARPAPGDPGRERRAPGPLGGAEPRVSDRADEAAGVPIGPEFDLSGLGIDDRVGAGPAPPRRTPIGNPIRLRYPGSNNPASKVAPIPRRLWRPAIAVGLAVIAVVAAFVLRFAFRSGEAGSRPIASPSARIDGGPIDIRKADRSSEKDPQPPPQSEWISRTIFDGRNAGDWMLTSKRPLPRKHVQPDGLNPHGTGSYLVVYQNKLGDFILDFDYKLSPGCNSGVFLRVGDLDDPVNTGIEVSIEDSPGTGDEAPGAVHGLVAPSVNAQRRAGQWNHMTITAQGPMIAVSLNGTDVSRIRLDEWNVPGKRPDGTPHRFTRLALAKLPRRGYLGFQDLVGDCWFRHIVVRTPEGSADLRAGDVDR